MWNSAAARESDSQKYTGVLLICNAQLCQELCRVKNVVQEYEHVLA